MQQPGAVQSVQSTLSRLMSLPSNRKTTTPFESLFGKGPGAKPPWIDDGGNRIWGRARIWTFKFLNSEIYEMCMACVIIFNVYLIIWDTDVNASCFPAYDGRVDQCPHKVPHWVDVMGVVLLVLYTIEASLRCYLERERFIYSPWNFLDVFIVFAGWLNEVANLFVNVAFLRFFRVLRLIRVLRVFIVFKELYMLLVGLVSAMRTIAWGALMLFTMLLLFGIIFVEFVHPNNVTIDFGDCERCPRGFGSVMGSVLTLFQTIVAGDSWGTIAVPLIEHSPWAAVFLVSSVLIISLGITNLILAVIVDRAAEAREHDVGERLKQKEQEQEQQKEKLFVLCGKMDKDGSGQLNLDELLGAYDHYADFRNTLNMMDIRKEELKSLVKVLDTDGSGEIDYKEFCEQLQMIKTRDTRTMLTFVKLAITECQETVDRKSSELLQIVEGRHQMQAQMLAAISDSLRTLSHGAPVRAGNHGPASLPAQPRAPPQPAADPQPPLVLSRAGVLKELRLLDSGSQKAASMEGQLLQRLEDQFCKVSGQGQALTELAACLERQGRDLIEDLAREEWARIDDKLARLRSGMLQELQGLLEDLDQRLEDGSAAIARNGHLVASLAGDLGCPLVIEDLARKPMKGAFRKPTAEPPNRDVMLLPNVGGRGQHRVIHTAPMTPMEMCGCAPRQGEQGQSQLRALPPISKV